MRCLPYLLPQYLQKGWLPSYLLFGSEHFLIEESARAIRQKAAQENLEHHSLIIQQTEDLVTLTATAMQPSLFAEQRLIEVRCLAINPQIELNIASLLQSLPENTYFLVHAGQLSRKQQQNPWFNILLEKGLVIPHWPLSGAQYTKWLAQRAKQRDLKLSAETLSQLAYFTEGNCLAGAQEIEKLCLVGGPTLTETSIANNVEQQSQFEIFDLCQAALQKRPAQVIKILNILKTSEAVPLQLILWALGQTLRALHACTFCPQEIGQRRLLSQAGILISVHDTYLTYLKMISHVAPINWSLLLSYLAQADKQFKSGNMKVAWRIILDICVNLAGVPIFSKTSKIGERDAIHFLNYGI